MDLKTVVKHLANGSLGSELCVVCLLPLGDRCENVFTSICKKNEEYCIADVLRVVCQIQILNTEYYNVCTNCFQLASVTYEFHMQAKLSHKIINFYTDHLLSNIGNVEISEEDIRPLLCIPLPSFTMETSSIDSVATSNIEDGIEINDETDKDKGNEVVMIVEDEKTLFYSVQDGALQEIKLEESDDDDNVLMIVNKKIRKKRDPMMFISCLHCPLKYRFVATLKKHEKKVHNADIYYCKICKLITDNKNEYQDHLLTHNGSYQCTDCNASYRKKSSFMEHLKSHYNSCDTEKIINGDICEICGIILESETALETHRAERHVIRFTCYYCGKMYKNQISFEMHIEKHEKYLKSNNKPHKNQDPKSNPTEKEESNSSKRCICVVCDKSFVDGRSLLFHQRLHNNDRPYICNVCGRAFISANRRNQHRICAHSLPSRQCPLCPSLFHLRSMVNTHVKKVHLNKQNKRRSRASKHRNVFWKTETVRIEDLSVSIQNDVLEIQSSQDNTAKQAQRKPIKAKPTEKQIYTKDNLLN